MLLVLAKTHRLLPWKGHSPPFYLFLIVGLFVFLGSYDSGSKPISNEISVVRKRAREMRRGNQGKEVKRKKLTIYWPALPLECKYHLRSDLVI